MERDCSVTVPPLCGIFNAMAVCFEGSYENTRLVTAICGRFCISGSATLNEFRQTTELKLK